MHVRELIGEKVMVGFWCFGIDVRYSDSECKQVTIWSLLFFVILISQV